MPEKAGRQFTVEKDGGGSRWALSGLWPPAEIQGKIGQKAGKLGPPAI